jgi:hypothetical protein
MISIAVRAFAARLMALFGMTAAVITVGVLDHVPFHGRCMMHIIAVAVAVDADAARTDFDGLRRGRSGRKREAGGGQEGYQRRCLDHFMNSLRVCRSSQRPIDEEGSKHA